jgi:hypothetical protein
MLSSDANDSRISSSHPMPLGLMAFFSYAMLFVAYDIVSAIMSPILPLRLVRDMESVTGSLGSLPYVFAMIVIVAFALGNRCFSEYSVRPHAYTRLPYVILLLMGIQMCRGLAEYCLNQGTNVHSIGNYHIVSKWRLVISVFLPSVWVRVWFSKSVGTYLHRWAEQAGH